MSRSAHVSAIYSSSQTITFRCTLPYTAAVCLLLCVNDRAMGEGQLPPHNSSGIQSYHAHPLVSSGRLWAQTALSPCTSKVQYKRTQQPLPVTGKKQLKRVAVSKKYTTSMLTAMTSTMWHRADSQQELGSTAVINSTLDPHLVTAAALVELVGHIQ